MMRDNQGRFTNGHPFGKRFIKGEHASPQTEFKIIKGKPKCLDCGKQLANWRGQYCKKHVKAGSRSTFWKGGITSENYRIRRSKEYIQWRIAIFERDNYTCQMCFKKGGKLNADHIKPFALYPELRFDQNNGRTLCEDCHRKTPTWGNKALYRKVLQ